MRYYSWRIALIVILQCISGILRAQGWSSPALLDPYTIVDRAVFGDVGGMIFADSNTGYIGGPSLQYEWDHNSEFDRLFLTTDGGATWTKIHQQNGSGLWDRFVSCPDSESVYFFNPNGLTIWTNDRGLTWKRTSWGIDELSQSIRYQAMFTRDKGMLEDGETYAVDDSLIPNSTIALTDNRSGGNYGWYLTSFKTSFAADWSDSLHWIYAIREDRATTSNCCYHGRWPKLDEYFSRYGFS
jgi:hypothetical protein